MKKLLIGLLALSSVSSFANDVILKPGKSVVIEANTPTKILCESESNKAPYLCRIQFEMSSDFGTGKKVPTAVTITMKNKNVANDNFVYLKKSLFNIDAGRNEQERANYTLENDRILKVTELELHNLVAREICEKH